MLSMLVETLVYWNLKAIPLVFEHDGMAIVALTKTTAQDRLSLKQKMVEVINLRIGAVIGVDIKTTNQLS